MTQFEIENIEIEGFRGVNKSLSIFFNGKSTFLFGENAAGKTSILQAIEWCMFGQFAYLPSDEYKMQDAIVNFYTPNDRARVKLTLKTPDDKIIQLERTRKRGKSSTRGKTSLSIRINGLTLTDKQAESELTKILELTPEEYYARAHLHQETTRDLLFGQITDRSTMIDKMLGLYNLRTLIEALPLSLVDREINALEKSQVATQQTKNKIERLLQESGKAIDKIAEALENAKVSSDTVSLDSILKKLNEIDDKIIETGSLLELEIKSVQIPKSLEESRSTPDVLNRNLTLIENKRTEMYGKLMQDLQGANQLYKTYKNLVDEKEKLKMDPNKIATEKEEIVSSLSVLSNNAKKIENKYLEIKAEEPIAKRIAAEKKQYRDTIKGITQKYGTREEVGARIEEFMLKVKTLSELIKQQDLLSKIVNLGARYLQISKVDKCPICEAKITKDQIQTSLSQRIREKGEAKLILRLSNEINDINQQKEENQKALNMLNEFSLKYERTNKETDERTKRLEKLGLTVDSIKTPEQLMSYLITQIEKVEKELQEIAKKKDALIARKTELETAKQKIEDLKKTETEIQNLLNVRSKGTELLDKLGDYSSKINSSTKEILKLGERAVALREKINLVKTMVEYLIKKEEKENTERSLLPGVENKLKRLNEKLSEAQELGAALHDIHDAAISAQEEFLEITLSPLQNDMNKFYSKIVSHPTFERLVLEPEMLRGKYIYRIKALSQDGTDWTYVQTGLSLAQMNLTAIAIFFAMAVKDPLGFVILDDPSQSLDPQHKKALASLIAEICMKEQVLVATQDEQFIVNLQKATSKINPTLLNLGKWNRNGPSLNLPT